MSGGTKAAAKQPVRSPRSEVPAGNMAGNLISFLKSPRGYLPLIVLVITFICFIPALRNNFIPTWDDEKYVTGNPVIKELTADNVRKMFTKQVNGTYVPLPLITFAIEYKLFGDNPLPYHATNLLLNLLCTLLVWRILRQFGIDPVFAAFGAMIFGIHPVHVESVAWVTERKDMLFGLFYLAALSMYITYVSDPAKNRKILWWGLALFLGALFSKIEAVTLPLGMLLVDYLIKRPFSLKLITEKIPHFLLSLFFGLLGVYIILRVGQHGEILKAQQELSLADRLFYALHALTGYLIKFVVPYPLSVIYPYPSLSGWNLAWIRFINPALIAVLAWLVYRSARKIRYVAFGMLFFLVNIVFLLQVFAVGNAYFADRFAYIPYLGLVVITAFFASGMASRYPSRRPAVIAVLSVFCLVFVVQTFNRTRTWRDGISLWTDVIDNYPGRVMEAYANRGISYTLVQDWPRAEADLTAALQMGPASAGIYADRGMVYAMTNQSEKAVGDFTQAVALDPGNVKVLLNRGVAYANSGQTSPAIADLRKVLDLAPDNVTACQGLAILLFDEGNFDSCLIMTAQGLKINAYDAGLLTISGNCRLEQGSIDQAIDDFRHSLRIDDTSLDAYLGLVAAFLEKSDTENARHYYDAAMRKAQEQQVMLNSLGDISRAGIALHDRKKSALLKVFTP